MRNVDKIMAGIPALEPSAKPPTKPPTATAGAGGNDHASERARKYVAKMPAAISGQNGHGATLAVARVLVHDFALSDVDAWPILTDYNARCEPPWPEKDLRHKLSEARKLSDSDQCQNSRGHLLAARAESKRTVGSKRTAKRNPARHNSKPTTTEGQNGAPPEPPKSQATLLVELASNLELFHTPDTDGDTYATIIVDGHKENWRIRCKAFRTWLQRLFYERFKKAAGGQAVEEALGILEGTARFAGPAYPVFVRLAAQNGAIYLDLGDEKWRAVEVATAGWRVIDNPPVKFIRPRGMLALPEPQRGGNLGELRQLLNVTDYDWPLVLMWLLNACRATGPFIVLVVNGEQGSAKTTFCKILVALLDPHKAALRAAPRDDRDLMISANNSWVLAFDNLSSIPPWLSDALCRLATGGGLASRELFTDGEEKIFEAQRPILINGIEELATRPDLVDRSICITLPALDETKYRSEVEIWQAVDTARPRILGVLLDAMSTALRNLPNLKLKRLPRMADAALWAVAGESALGVEAGTFLERYGDNRQQADDLVLDSSTFGNVVRMFMAGRENWRGTATDLGNELSKLAGDDVAKARDWPKTARAIGGALRRIAPNLRRIGITVVLGERDNDKKRSRIISLENTGKSSSVPSVPSAVTGNGLDDSGRLRFGADGAAA